MKFLKKIFFLQLNSNSRIFFVFLLDIHLCIITLWISFYLRLDKFIFFEDINVLAFGYSILISSLVFWIFGIYKYFVRFVEKEFIFKIFFSVFFYGVVYFSIVSIYGLENVPRSIGILQPIIFITAVVFSRFFIQFIYTSLKLDNKNRKNKEDILIYGAGSAGRQVLLSLANSSKYNVDGFIDDNKDLQGRFLLNKKIYSLSQLEKNNKLKNISFILFAIPSINKQRKSEIIEKLSKNYIAIRTLPSISEIIDKNITISDIKDFLIEDLLEREVIKPNDNLLKKNITHKNVFVSGAGGTIGSELCRQIVKLNPKKLILYELNEFSLFKIQEKLLGFNVDIEIVCLLGSILDQENLEKIFEIYDIDTVYHSAAYKHVHIVESNVCEGIKNNIFGTLKIINAAINKKVNNFVFISSDKAVRPTSIMGVTKRFSEICIQSIYFQKKKIPESINTIFSIVRFGNVLESSGSVIPKFKAQINNGGPITLTHPEVTRYFMTITEAAQLVIQAGALAVDCEVFVLDMGKSIKIKDLIVKLINLSGLTVKDEQNLNGDIEIKITGLKPGEKLFEELLIGDNPIETIHSKILKINEPFLNYQDILIYIDQLNDLIKENDIKKIIQLLEKAVKLYNSNSQIVDFIYNQKNKFEKKNNIKISNNSKIVEIKKI